MSWRGLPQNQKKESTLMNAKSESFEQGVAERLLLAGVEFGAAGGEVEHVDDLLACSVDERDPDIAPQLGHRRAHLIEQTRPVLSDQLNQSAVRGAGVVETDLRRHLHFGAGKRWTQAPL